MSPIGMATAVADMHEAPSENNLIFQLSEFYYNFPIYICSDKIWQLK